MEGLYRFILVPKEKKLNCIYCHTAQPVRVVRVHVFLGLGSLAVVLSVTGVWGKVHAIATPPLSYLINLCVYAKEELIELEMKMLCQKDIELLEPLRCIQIGLHTHWIWKHILFLQALVDSFLFCMASSPWWWSCRVRYLRFLIPIAAWYGALWASQNQCSTS